MTRPSPRNRPGPDREQLADRDAKTPESREVRIAVIGAGVAGLAAARSLHDRGLRVTVFDKARGPGGRTSTRRTPEGPFDHGAPHFTARDPRFVAEVRSWQRVGVVAPLNPRIASWSREGFRKLDPPEGGWFSGATGMSAACRHLSRDLDLHLRERISAVEGRPGAWTLVADDGRDGPFDLVVVAVPAPQAIALLAPVPELAAEAARASYEPCIAALCTFTTPPPLEWDALIFEEGPLGRALRQHDATESPEGSRWVLHAAARWSREHLEEDPGDRAEVLLRTFCNLWPDEGPAVSKLTAHRWRYSRVVRSLGKGSLFDPASGIGACGDWCHGPDIEGAWLSGTALAGDILDR